MFKKKRGITDKWGTFSTCRLWILVHSAESARGLLTACLVSRQLSWLKCHMTPTSRSWISTKEMSVRPNGRINDDPDVFECVNNRAQACRRCCRNSSANESATGAPGTARRERSSGKPVSTSRHCTLSTPARTLWISVTLMCRRYTAESCFFNSKDHSCEVNRFKIIFPLFSSPQAMLWSV